MLQPIIDAILANLTQVVIGTVIAIVGAIVAFSFQLLRRLPLVLRSFAEQLRVKALQTPGKADDVAAQILVSIADALEEALDANLPKTKRK